MRQTGVNHFKDLRVWQSARAFKNAIYRLVDTPSFVREARLRDQLREAAASAVSHISEGHARFEPLDQARFLRMAKASLVECQNHLIDAVDRRVITEAVRQQHDDMVADVLKQISAFIIYLQSSQAKKNADRIKKRRDWRRKGSRRANAELEEP
jgi:four helix bundle protein